MKRSTIVAMVLTVTALWAGMAHAIGTIQIPRTGQGQAGTCWSSNGALIPCANTGQDGDKQKGAALPAPRFTDIGDGTVRDNLTGLVWLKNANCWSTGRDWNTALAVVNALADGQCGLTDGSTAGQWRLPNIKELESLIDITGTGPALPAGHPFSNVSPGLSGCGGAYHSSTTSSDPLYSYVIFLGDGVTPIPGGAAPCGNRHGNKNDAHYMVWAVR